MSSGNNATGVLWRRLRYLLSPQLDLYKHLAPHLEGDYVLEIGFGTGAGVMQYAPVSHRVVAVEFDKASIAFAEEIFPHPKVEWNYGDATYYVPGKNFDSIIMIEVLEHIPEWNVALQRVCEALADDGTLYVSGPNSNADLRKNDIHEREWRAGEFRKALEIFFEDVKLYDYTLSHEQDDDTTVTPLVGVCNGKKVSSIKSG